MKKSNASEKHGKRGAAGSKLARKAAEGSIGMMRAESVVARNQRFILAAHARRAA